MRRYNHNAVSNNSPLHFQGNYSQIANEKLLISRKKPVNSNHSSYKVQSPRLNCRSLPPMNYDQDLDSIRFSDRQAVNQGLKNSIRFKSKFYQEFYNNVDNVFKKPEKQITFMQPVKKVVRDLEKPIQNLSVQKSIRRLLEVGNSERIIRDIDPGNRLLQDFEVDEPEVRSPVSTGVKFFKQSLPNLAKVSGKINCILISQEIQEFEKKIPELHKKKGNLWYKNILND